MRSAKFIWMVVFSTFVLSDGYAGSVRTISTTSREMPIVHLMTGRSTVLRFPATPKKVVLGNQNYFNVEFIEADITLQPLGAVTSNLFVYGDGYTYGFILKVNQGGEYDDLVFVRGKVPFLGPEPVKAPPKKPVPRPPQKFSIVSPKKSVVQLEGDAFKWNEQLQCYFSDVFVTSKSNEPIAVSALNLKLLSGATNLSSIDPVFEEELAAPNKRLRVRLFSKLESKMNVQITLRIDGKDMAFDIKWKK